MDIERADRVSELVAKAAARAIALSLDPVGHEDDIDDVFEGIASLIGQIRETPTPDIGWHDGMMSAAVAVRSLAATAFIEAKQPSAAHSRDTADARVRLTRELVNLERIHRAGS